MGEQGRGFAVVAGEVRSLGASAAKEIKQLIGDSAEKVESGSALVSRAGTTMDEIVQAVRRVTDIMGEISAASDEQSTGIEQVNRAVGQMDSVTQQNAALVEQAAAAAASLEEQTRQMKAIVSGWRVAGGIVLAPSRGVARPVAHGFRAGADVGAAFRRGAGRRAAGSAGCRTTGTARRAGAAPPPRLHRVRAMKRSVRPIRVRTRTRMHRLPAARLRAAMGRVLAKTAAPADKPAAKPALVRPALNGEKPAAATAGTSDDDWETF